MLCPSSRCPWLRYGAVLWLTKRCAGPAAAALSTRMVLFLAVHEGGSRGARSVTDKRFHSICCYLSYLAQSDPDLRDDAVDRFCEAYGLRRRSCFGFVKNLCASIIAMRLNYQGHRFGRTKAKAQPQSEAPPSRPIYPPTVPPSERQRAVWDGLNAWVGDRGGQITSQPYAQPIVLEVPLDSPLPEKLRSLGWDPIYRGRETRIGTAPAEYDRAGPQRPVTGYAFNQRDVYHLVAPRR